MKSTSIVCVATSLAKKTTTVQQYDPMVVLIYRANSGAVTTGCRVSCRAISTQNTTISTEKKIIPFPDTKVSDDSLNNLKIGLHKFGRYRKSINKISRNYNTNNYNNNNSSMILLIQQDRQLLYSVRAFSTETDPKNNKKDEQQKESSEKGEEESLEEVIRKMKKQQGIDNESSNNGTESSGTSSSSSTNNDTIRYVLSIWDTIRNEISLSFDELRNAGERKSINKKLEVKHPTETGTSDTSASQYTGPMDIMIIDPNDERTMTAWGRMQKRLTNAPIIQRIFEQSEQIYNTSGIKDVKEKIDTVKDDAREAWETSQNPWVYRISSVYDTLTANTPESIALLELRKLDPNFTYDDWRQDVIEHTLPLLMKWFLEGKINLLQPWFGESVFKRIAAEMTAREKEGVQIDTNVLAIMNSEILAVEPDEINKGSPIIVLHFMCQQINCVRKKKDGTIVEGGESDIRANSYVAAFQREYNEDTLELNWKIVDFRFNGAIAYL